MITDEAIEERQQRCGLSWHDAYLACLIERERGLRNLEKDDA